MPKLLKPKCIACGGIGKSSKGKKCVPCRGMGRKQKSQTEGYFDLIKGGKVSTLEK